MNVTLRNAIINAINSKCELNKALAAQLTGTTAKQRDTLLFEAAQIVAQTYGKIGKTNVEAYASRKGNGITFGTLMTDGTHERTKASEAARNWFSSNILRAGFISLKKDAPHVDSKTRLMRAASMIAKKYSKAQVKAIIALLEAEVA